MRKWLKTRRSQIAAASIVLVILWLAYSSESFQGCVQAPNNADAENAFYEGISQFLTAAGIVRGCTGYFLHESGEALTALATIIIGIFTWTLWTVTAKSVNLARDEFLASHRPKIRVRAIDFDPGSDGEKMALGFTCVNIGDSPCEIVGASYLFSVTEKAASPTKRKKMFNIEIPQPIKLAAGEPAKFTTHVVSEGELKDLGGYWDFWGMIQYLDPSGVIRLTGFWRRFEARTNDFTAPQNPGFNDEY